MPDADQLADTVIGFNAGPEQVTAATAVIAELVRRINHCLTNNAVQALPAPQDVDRVIADLHTAVARLPQLMEHLELRLGRIADDPRLRVSGNDGREPGRVAHSGGGCLDPYIAGAKAEALAADLNSARRETSRLYLDG